MKKTYVKYIHVGYHNVDVRFFVWFCFYYLFLIDLFEFIYLYLFFSYLRVKRKMETSSDPLKYTEVKGRIFAKELNKV